MPVRVTQLALTLQSFSTEDVCSASSANRTGNLCAYRWKRPLLPIMPALLLLLLLLSVYRAAFTEPLQRAHSIRKRGLLELAGVIKCSTGRSALAYIMYGCYCGLGGEGWPRDKADWCCHKHDCCYERAEQAGCKPKTDKYHWTCEDRVADCESLKDRCERMLCRCDREAAKCLRRAPYIPKYAVWPDFLCGYDHPTCSYY